MQKTLKTILACLLLAATLPLTACFGKKTAEKEDPEAAGREALTLSFVELSGYSVVWPDISDLATRTATDKLVSALKSSCGVDLEADTDYVGWAGEVPTGTKEILIGATNRQESVGVRYLDYVVTNENGRIVISGGCGEKNAEAVDWFLANCVGADSVTVPAWHRSASTYPGEDATVGGIPLSQFALPEAKGSADDTLRDYLGKQFGIRTKSSDGYEIQILLNDSVNATEYAVRLDGKILSVVGSSALGDAATVVRNALEYFEKSGNTVSLMEHQPMVISEQLRSASDADMERLRKMTDDRIAEILSTPNVNIPSGATVYYVSPNGNDSNDGKSPAKAWKSIAKVNSATLSSGSYVCFERGGLWREGGTALKAQAGVTYTAYGTGAKPMFYGSPENGADATKWKRTDKTDVWYYDGSETWGDVGVIVFNEGESCAVKIVRQWVGGKTVNYTTGEGAFDGYKDLTDDLTFYHDTEKTGRLYLYSEENPGKRFSSIEFNVKNSLISVGTAGNVTIDNLALRYGGSHGVAAGSGSTVKNLTVQNCDFAWIGGSVQSVSDETHGETRFGNGVEVYGGCENFTVQNCCFDQIYDTAVTHQYSGVGTTVYDAKNVRYLNNVMEHCVYSIEYFYSGCAESNPSVMDGLLIEGNLMWNASYGFCEQRPRVDRSWGAHIKGRCSGTGNRAKNYVIRNNYFIGCKDRMVQITSNLYNPDRSDSMPKFSGNVFVLAYGSKFGQVEQSEHPEVQTDAKFTLDVVSYLGNRSDGSDQFWFAPED